MMKRLIPWIALCLLAGAGYYWWQRSATAATASIAYRTAVAARGSVVQTVTGSGTLSALTTVDVGSQVSGNVQKLHVDFNDTVKAGQLLAEIDPSTYEARLFQAEANLQSSQATLQLRQLNVKRASQLLEKQLLAQSDYDQALAELRQQEAQAKNAEAAVKSARLDLERCKIYSPVDGVVLKRSIDAGQTVQSNFNVATLFSIAKDLRRMEISAAISEADIGTVDAGQSVTFTVDAFSGRSFQGTVRQVRNNSTITSNVVTYPVIITVDNSDLKLRPGMTANIIIATTKRDNALRLPNAALRFKPPEGAVVAASEPPAGADGTPARGSGREGGFGPPPGDGMAGSGAPGGGPGAGASGGAGQGGFGPPSGPGGVGGGPQMGTRGGMQGGPGGGGMRMAGGSGPRSGSGGVQRVTLYVTRAQPGPNGQVSGELVPVMAIAGISDSTYTEILSGVKEGDVIVTGVVSAQAAAAAKASGTNNIFGPPRPPGTKTR